MSGLKKSFSGNGRFRHLNAALWAADRLAVVGEEVEPLLGVYHQLGAGGALKYTRQFSV